MGAASARNAIIGPPASIFIHTQATVEGHHHPGPSDGLHLDHWAVCSGGGGEGLCLPLCLCQCVSGERGTILFYCFEM